MNPEFLSLAELEIHRDQIDRYEELTNLATEGLRNLATEEFHWSSRRDRIKRSYFFMLPASHYTHLPSILIPPVDLYCGTYDSEMLSRLLGSIS